MNLAWLIIECGFPSAALLSLARDSKVAVQSHSSQSVICDSVYAALGHANEQTAETARCVVERKGKEVSRVLLGREGCFTVNAPG